MKLVKVRVHNFRSIVDSTEVEFQPDVTGLVGKNESGKSAFLEALYLLKPRVSGDKFDVHRHYPAWLIKRDRAAAEGRGEELESFVPVNATFAVEDQDRRSIEELFGAGVFTAEEVTVSRSYEGRLSLDFKCDEARAVANVLAGVALPETVSSVAKAKSFRDLDLALTQLREKDDEDGAQIVDAVEGRVKAVLGDKTFNQAIVGAVNQLVPSFFRFTNYAMLPSEVDVKHALSTPSEQLEESDRTAVSLLRQGGTDDDYLTDPDYERRTRELESVAIALTDDVLSYWTQNPDLRVLVDVTKEKDTDPQGQSVALVDMLKIRVWDERHRLSLPFEERSTGFRWFFSFQAAFSEYRYKPDPLIILLDEPAQGLHATAQRDFLRFIDERLVDEGKRQVIYTTHSPFMVQAGKLERIRLVMDRGRDEGSRVSSDVLSVDAETIFPLQAALGYDLAQNILVPGPQNLVIEGTSDLTYFETMSEHLSEQGRVGLDRRWTLSPLGGLDLIPAFAAFLGHHLDVTVLVDARRKGHQKLSLLAQGGYLDEKRIITMGQVLGRPAADVEDLFAVEDYLRLYNAAFGARVEAGALSGTDPVVKQLARVSGDFNHGRPADYLLRHKPELLPMLSAETLNNFEELFKRVNATLPAEG